MVPSRFTRGAATSADREVFILDPSLLAVAYVPGRKLKTLDIAVTGDADKGALLSEYTLEVRQEAGLGAVFDLT
jgi:hypothetical protein